MKICVDLQFAIPIWRIFYDPIIINKIPYQFVYNGITYSNGITIIQIPHYVNEKKFFDKNYFNNLKCQNPIITVPNQATYNLFKKYRPQYTVIIAGHNAFINENKYTITNEIKKYDLIINSSFTKLKNLHLSKNIQNKIYIGYKCGSLEEFNQCIPNDGYIPNFENRERNIDNWKWVDNQEIIKYYNQSKVGGIFSTHEGSCFSSSEYLLCGLPVVSVFCDGGREYWYNNNNSILCNPNINDIEHSINLAIHKLETKEFDPIKIRNDHIDKMNIQRKTLTDTVYNLFAKITNNLPNYNSLYDSLKYYHSNNRYDPNNPSCDIIQSNKEMCAIEILGKNMEVRIEINNEWFLFKQHFIKKNNTFICKINTFLKKNINNSSCNITKQIIKKKQIIYCKNIIDFDKKYYKIII